MAKKKVACGVFGWGATERQSNRYGSFHCGSQPFDGSATCIVFHDELALRELRGKQVRITCVVIESRVSAHIGDMFLGITPSRPNVGEEVDLGVGILRLEGSDYDPTLVDLVLKPNDGRSELWYDPRKLYRLHDQTVEVYAEETEDPFSDAPQIKQEEEGVKSFGDGSFQMKGLDTVVNGDLFAPTIEKIGEGTFMLTPAPLTPKGTRLKVIKAPRVKKKGN